MFKVFYYYYYLFYSKVLVQSDPYFEALFVLSFTESIFLNFLSDFIAIELYCYSINKWYMISMTALLFGVNFMYFHKSGRAKKIIKEKPNFFSSHAATKVIILLLTVIIISFLFIGPVLSKKALINCGTITN